MSWAVSSGNTNAPALQAATHGQVEQRRQPLLSRSRAGVLATSIPRLTGKTKTTSNAQASTQAPHRVQAARKPSSSSAWGGRTQCLARRCTLRSISSSARSVGRHVSVEGEGRKEEEGHQDDRVPPPEICFFRIITIYRVPKGSLFDRHDVMVRSPFSSVPLPSSFCHS